MIYGSMTYPQLLHAPAVTGYGSKVLLADTNYPHTTGVSPRYKLVSPNSAPGMLDVTQTLEALKQAYPIEKAEIVVPVPDAPQVQIPIHEEFKAQLLDTELAELSRSDFYNAARSRSVGIIVATGEQRLYGNLLLTVGVRIPGQ